MRVQNAGGTRQAASTSRGTLMELECVGGVLAALATRGEGGLRRALGAHSSRQLCGALARGAVQKALADGGVAPEVEAYLGGLSTLLVADLAGAP